MRPKGQGPKYAWLQTEKGRAYTKRHNKNGAERTARWREKQPRDEFLAKHAEQQRAWRLTPHGKRMKRDGYFRKAYGITLDQMEAMIAAQHGACPICLRKINTMGKGRDCPAVDHNHSTGAIRGILCQPCNAALGTFGDDMATLKRAFDYLKK